MATTVVPTESVETSSYKYVKKRAAHLKITCRIAKFEALMNTSNPGGGGLLSEEVSSELVPGAVCKLSIYPNGCHEQSKGNTGFFLQLTGPIGKKETQQATFHIYIMSGFDGEINSVARDSKNFGQGDYSWGCEASHDQVRKALHADGSLVVAADIELLPSDDDGALQCDAEQHQWPTKFSELHGDQKFSDCRIEIGGVSIPAHKCILVAQSPIFRSMFSHQEAEECKSGVIKITDFKNPKPMRAVLRYCYQGFLDDSTMDGAGAVETFKLADRYCIAGLKAHLEKHFADKSLNVENVVGMAVLADTYNALKLKEACIKLIARERKVVFECADWKEVMKARPELAAQLAVATCLKL